MKNFKKVWFDIILLVFLLVVLFVEGLDNLNIGTSNPLLFIVAIIGTIPVLWSAIKVIINRKISVDLLAAIALIFSLFEHEWLSAVFINLMLTSSRLLLAYNEASARKNIESLLKLKPVKIKVERNGKIIEVKYLDVVVGDMVIVDLGERIPVDGTIISGQASIDESSLTGESIPINKSINDKVASSGLIVSGHLIIKTEKVSGDTTLEKIIKLVEDAQIDKPNIHTSAEKFATWYLIIVFIGTIVLYFLNYNIIFILAILLVICADDIAVAVPLTFLSAISFCAKKGIIIKGSSFIEALPKVKIIFVDKTGTLTKGKLKVEHFSCDLSDKNLFLKYAGICSELSDHPVSKAIAHFALEIDKSENEKPKLFNEVEGNGMKAIFKNSEFILGKVSFLKENKIEFSTEILEKINFEQEKGFNVTVFAFAGEYCGYFSTADEIKENVKKSIQELKNLGIEKIIMLTGDNEAVAKRIMEKTGITHFYANLLPEQKLNYIKDNLSTEYKVVMIGDGINDAAALSLADIGIAMGGMGYDVAIESADIVLIKDDFSRIPELIRISKYILKIAQQDFWIWGFTNTFGLLAVFYGFLLPTGASAYNFITDFIPLINSTRIFKVYLKEKTKNFF